MQLPYKALSKLMRFCGLFGTKLLIDVPVWYSTATTTDTQVENLSHKIHKAKSPSVSKFACLY